MTSIVVDLRVGLVGADTFTDYGFQVDKINRCRWRGKPAIFGCAGDDTAISRFEDWVLRKGKKPEQLIQRSAGDGTEDFQAIVATDGHILVFDGAMRGDVCRLPYHAIGSGAHWILGAMDAGATLQKALEIAANRDGGTKPPFTFIEV